MREEPMAEKELVPRCGTGVEEVRGGEWVSGACGRASTWIIQVRLNDSENWSIPMGRCELHALDAVHFHMTIDTTTCVAMKRVTE